MNKISKLLIVVCLLLTLTLISGCKKKYTVTYKVDDETISSSEYKKGTSIEVDSNVPTKEGYKFIAWEYDGKEYKSGDKLTVDNNIEFNAKWEKEQDVIKPEPDKMYTVTYQTGNGIFNDGTSEKVLEYKEGTSVTLITEIPAVPGSEFKGWINEANNEPIEGGFVINSNMVLVASYGAPMWTITYRANGGKFSDGSNLKVLEVNQGGVFEYIETPVNGERLFNGWYDSETDEYIVPGMQLTGDLEVKARYSRPGNEYYITLNTNGGLLEIDNVIKHYEDIYFNLPIPEKAGFQFNGWFDNPEFTGNPIIYLTDEVKGNQEFFASWTLVDVKYAENLFNELVPDEISENLEFPATYQGVSLYFETSNSKVLNPKGIINPTHKKEVVTVSCQIGIDGKYYNYSKDVTVNAIVFEDMNNPVAGYFYNTKIVNQTEITLEHLDIVYYAFAHVTEGGNVTVQAASNLTKMMNEAVEMRKEKSMRFVLSIAGGAAAFAAACRNGGYISVADKIIDIILQYNMDGVDIDWEFPQDGTDMENMYQLCARLRERLDKIADGTGSPYLVTAAIPSHTSYSKFNLKKLNDVLDYVNMMSYDMNLAGKATHLCPLHKSKYDSGQFGVSLGVEWFTKAGLDANKIIIGAAFYGKSYKVTGSDMWPGIYPALGASAELHNMQYQSGTITYKYIYQNVLTNNNYKRYYDTIARVPYLYSATDRIFITYEDEESLRDKVDYAYENGFGIMFWEYGYDYQNILTDSICNRVAEHKAGTIE